MKNIIISLLIVLLAQLSVSQTMSVYKNDKTSQTFQLSQIDSITFQIGATPIPGQWLTYDDGGYESTLTAQSNYYYLLVRFDKPSGWTNYKVTQIKMNFVTDASNDSIYIRGYNTQLSSGNYYPYQQVYAPTDKVHPVAGWNQFVVNWSLNLDRFCLGYFQVGLSSPSIKCDTTPTATMRSYVVYQASSSSTSLTVSLLTNADFAIQAYVEQTASSSIANPVGMWLEGVVSKEDIIRKGIQQNSPMNINYEAIPLKELQNNVR